MRFAKPLRVNEWSASRLHSFIRFVFVDRTPKRASWKRGLVSVCEGKERMNMITVLKPLILESKDGEWGKGEAFADAIEMAVIRGTDFEDARVGNLNGLPMRFIPAHIASRKTLQPNDILIETAGGSGDRPTGRTLFIKPSLLHKTSLPVTCASFSRFIRIDPQKADPNYIYWCLQHKFADGRMWKYSTRHTGVARFQYTIFSETEEFVLPPLPTQRRIASILSAYDDLIENNTRRIKILEEMAQLIYREWFVHFRFPGHEGVRGGVPEGWVVKRFSDLVQINPSMKVSKDEEYPFVEMAGLSIGSMVIECNETRGGGSGGSKFQNGDTLFPRITPSVENGKGGFVQFLPEGGIGLGSTEFIVMRSVELCPEFVFLASKMDDFRENAAQSMVGASGRQRVQNQCFDAYMVAKPPKPLLEKFSEVISPMFTLIQALANKNANLRQTRDLLLPKLVSGEVEVSEMEVVGAEPTL
jgi:type I restriction enzyme S subunit